MYTISKKYINYINSINFDTCLKYTTNNNNNKFKGGYYVGLTYRDLTTFFNSGYIPLNTAFNINDIFINNDIVAILYKSKYNNFLAKYNKNNKININKLKWYDLYKINMNMFLYQCSV